MLNVKIKLAHDGQGDWKKKSAQPFNKVSIHFKIKTDQYMSYDWRGPSHILRKFLFKIDRYMKTKRTRIMEL